MNYSRLLNLVLGVALVVVLATTARCSHRTSQSSQPMTENTDTAQTSQTKGQWHSIDPTEIKNPVKLFADDWMALAVGKPGDMNAMTIAWGALGELWKRHVVTVYVSSDRYTHSFMERFDRFTLTALPESMRPALEYIGTHSGRDGDKLRAAGLTPEFTELGNPTFREGNLVIECRKIYSAPFQMSAIAPDVRHFYDKGTGIHTMYVGEILNVMVR